MDRVLSGNELVAYNLREARRLRGWTQERAGKEIALYLGEKAWSRASVSAAERAAAGKRPRHFDAGEIVAFARAFRVPVFWFFLPPPGEPGARAQLGWDSRSEQHLGAPALTVVELLDVVLGSSLAGYQETKDRLDGLMSGLPQDERSTLQQQLYELMFYPAIEALERSTSAMPGMAQSLRRLADLLEVVATERYAAWKKIAVGWDREPTPEGTPFLDLASVTPEVGEGAIPSGHQRPTGGLTEGQIEATRQREEANHAEQEREQ